VSVKITINSFLFSVNHAKYLSNIFLDMALQMAREWPNLAWARDKNKDTALHLLALNQNPMDSCCHSPHLPNPIKINPGKFLYSPHISKILYIHSKFPFSFINVSLHSGPIFCIAGMNQLVIFQLVNYLWNTMLHEKTIPEAIKIIGEPYQVLFDAAEVGNFGFLSELISAHPSLIWEVDNKNQSIIHTAVSYRHASIFNLVHEIGSQKDLIVTYIVKEDNPSSSSPKTKNNNLLHLAAKLAPPDQLELVSGAALQMCLEIIWFKVTSYVLLRLACLNIFTLYYLLY